MTNKLPERWDDKEPIVAAWNDYVKDHDMERLIAIASKSPPEELSLQWILWRALGASDWDLVKELEARGVSFPQEDDDDLTGWPIFGVLEDFGDAPHVVQWLLDHGAKIELRGGNDWTPLHHASNCGYVQIVETLLKNGADVNARTNIDGGYTPLMEACARGHKVVVETLLAAGADPSIQSTYGEGIARDIAAKKGHVEIVAMLDRLPTGRSLLDRWAKKIVMVVSRNPENVARVVLSMFTSFGVMTF